MCVCVRGIIGLDGYAGMAWGGYMYIFARGLTSSYHNVVWQADQCFINFFIQCCLTEPDADTPGMARYSSRRYSWDDSIFQLVP